MLQCLSAFGGPVNFLIPTEGGICKYLLTDDKVLTIGHMGGCCSFFTGGGGLPGVGGIGGLPGGPLAVVIPGIVAVAAGVLVVTDSGGGGDDERAPLSP